MAVDIEQTSQNFGQWINSLPDLNSKFSLNKILDDSYIEETKVTEWYDNSLQQVSDASRSHVFELVAKTLIYQWINGSSDLDSSLDTTKSTSIVLLGTLLDIITVLVRAGRVDNTLPLILVEELFEIQTIGWCHKFWPYMISRERTLTSNLTGTRAPGTTLIRLCNSLLRRLSKNQNAQFSGEIAIFLARAFPLNEKSGLNIRGSFNTENVTFYSGAETTEGKTEGEEEDNENNDKNDMPRAPSVELSEEDKLYRKFWSLQRIFSDPVQLTTSPELMTEFKNDATEILCELKRRESAHNTKRDRESEQRRMEIDLEENDGDEGVFVPKWLTRRDLFELQLKDITFRRSILTQLSIIIDFLLGLSEKAKSRWSSDQLGATNKSVMFSFTLPPEDVSFFQNMEKSFQKTTFASVDFDPAYLRTITTIMQRDRYWQDWKLKNCPSFEEPILDQEEVTEAKDKLNNVLMKPRNKFWHAMGTAPLTKIWKIKVGIESLSNPKRYSIPDAKTYYDKIKEETIAFKEAHEVEVSEDPIPDAAKSEVTEEQGSKDENKAEDAKTQEIQDETMEDKPLDTVEKTTIETNTPPSAPIKKKKLVISKQEQHDFDERMGSKTWRGLRAARSQGYWAKFGQVTKDMGFSGLYETPTPKIQTLQAAVTASQTGGGAESTSPAPTPGEGASSNVHSSAPGTPASDGLASTAGTSGIVSSTKDDNRGLASIRTHDEVSSTPAIVDSNDSTPTPETNPNKRQRID